MPRKKRASWMLKAHVWDLHGKGFGNEPIRNQLPKFILDNELYEDVPSENTIKNIISELQSLPVPVLLELPEHVWRIRDDVERIRHQLPGGEAYGSSPLAESNGHWNLLRETASLAAQALRTEDRLTRILIDEFGPAYFEWQARFSISGAERYVEATDSFIRDALLAVINQMDTVVSKLN